MRGYGLACRFGLKRPRFSSITLTWRNSGGHGPLLGGGRPGLPGTEWRHRTTGGQASAVALGAGVGDVWWQGIQTKKKGKNNPFGCSVLI